MCDHAWLEAGKGLPQGNTCVSMAKMQILGPKCHQNDVFFDDFSFFSGRSGIT